MKGNILGIVDNLEIQNRKKSRKKDCISMKEVLVLKNIFKENFKNKCKIKIF